MYMISLSPSICGPLCWLMGSFPIVFGTSVRAKIVLECAWMMLLATTSRSHHSASFHSGCFFGFRFACHGLWKSRWDRVLHPTPNTTWADSWCHNPYDYMILYEYVMSQPQPNHIPYSFLLYISVYLHIKPYHDIDPGKPAAEVSQT